MPQFEYHVVPAPRRGEKIKGAKTTEDRFAAALTRIMNDLGAEGWEYVRADTLPCDERSGLTGTKTTFQNMLVFRRVLGAVDATEPAAGTGAVPLSALRVVTSTDGPGRPLGAANAPTGHAPAVSAAREPTA